MSTVKILLEVAIDNSTDWLGMDDYKQHDGVVSDLDAFEEMVKLEETTPLNLIIALSDASTESRFVAVEALEEQICPVCNGNVESVAFHNTGVDSSTHYTTIHQCKFCDGRGRVPFDRHKQFVKGRLLRELRLSKGETLSECAERLGVSVADISKSENGVRL
ncbi:hypothetical protein [Vibrio sp. HN007]|uniref:hypothetical protein n=1 Tax=Vibrio iocasae TaxID=3098914 RepID=UPI0035D4002D